MNDELDVIEVVLVQRSGIVRFGVFGLFCEFCVDRRFLGSVWRMAVLRESSQAVGLPSSG